MDLNISRQKEGSKSVNVVNIRIKLYVNAIIINYSINVLH